MMLEMRVYIEKRHKSREIEQPGAWFTPPIDYDELEERIGVTRSGAGLRYRVRAGVDD